MTEFTENNLVEQPSIALLQTLGWQTLNAFHEFEQAGGSPLGQETRLFWYNALIILSNGVISKVGSLTAGWEHFADWKKIEHEAEPDQASLATLLHGVCLPARLLDLVENFTLFLAVPGGLIKLVAKNHQYLGVNNALASLADPPARRGRLGVFWATRAAAKLLRQRASVRFGHTMEPTTAKDPLEGFVAVKSPVNDNQALPYATELYQLQSRTNDYA